MEGRHHSGISDCMNISKIVARLIKDGHRFQSPETIPDNFVPQQDTSFKDYNLTNRQPHTSYAHQQPQHASHGHSKYVSSCSKDGILIFHSVVGPRAL